VSQWVKAADCSHFTCLVEPFAAIGQAVEAAPDASTWKEPASTPVADFVAPGRSS
jgi:hypothetical protein